MQLLLSTDFQPVTDTKACVTFRKVQNNAHVAEVRIDYAFEGTDLQRVTIADLTGEMCLSAVAQMKIGLAAAELIDSFFTGVDAPSRIEV